MGGIAHARQEAAPASVKASVLVEVQTADHHGSKQKADCSRSSAASKADGGSDPLPGSPADGSCDCVCNPFSILMGELPSSADIAFNRLKRARDKLGWTSIFPEVNTPPIILS
jgi:hypothetical protein